MQKGKLLLTFILGIIAMNFVSAYGISSLGDMLDSIGTENIILVVVFIVSFALINFSLSRVFNRNPATAGVISFALALGITYGVNRSGFNIEGLLFDIGIDSELLMPILFLIITIGIIYSAFKFGFGKIMVLLGILSIILSYWAYESEIVFIIGIVLILLGLIFWWRRRKKRQNKGLDSDYSGMGNFGQRKPGFFKRQWEKEKQVMRERGEKWEVRKEKKKEEKEQQEKFRQIAEKLQDDFNYYKSERDRLKGRDKENAERTMKQIANQAAKMGIRLRF